MNDLSSISVIKRILSRHGFKLSHSLGQNFLVDPSVCPKMVQESGANKDICVLEIGPGIGVLTKELCKLAKKVVAVEIDEKLIPILSETLCEYDNVKVIHGDIMKIDLKELFKNQFGDCKAVVCANLPYYITSPIIMHLLEEKIPAEAITVMVQKEVAIRLCAPPGQRESAAVSSAVHYYSNPEILFEVLRDSFYPPPNVDSAVIRFEVRKEPPISLLNEEFFFQIVAAAFAQRRKTVVNSLSAKLKIPKAELADVLSKIGVSEKERAERLTLDNLAQLSNELYRKRE